MHYTAATRIPVGCSAIATRDVDAELKTRLGAAIRACRGSTTQDEVAERTGIGQSTLSSYEKGKNVPTVLALNAIERACGRPAGWISIQAGLVAAVTSVREAIETDPALTEGARETMRLFYDGAIKNVSKPRRRRSNT